MNDDGTYSQESQNLTNIPPVELASLDTDEENLELYDLDTYSDSNTELASNVTSTSNVNATDIDQSITTTTPISTDIETVDYETTYDPLNPTQHAGIAKQGPFRQVANWLKKKLKKKNKNNQNSNLALNTTNKNTGTSSA